MPGFDLTTNVKLDDPKSFAIALSKFGADTLSKPEKYISVKITYNETLAFAGTFDPAFMLDVVIRNSDVESCEEYSKAFIDFFKEKLGVEGDRGYVNFIDPGPMILRQKPPSFDKIPTLDLTTNVQLEDPTSFAIAFSKFSADTLSKPETYISVKITYNESLIFAGSFDPAFALTVDLDNLTVELNERYSKAFFDFFKEKLGVEGDRGYVTFIDPGRGFLGHRGTIFATFFAK